MSGIKNHQPSKGGQAGQNDVVSRRSEFPAIRCPLLFIAGLTAVFMFFMLGYHIGRTDRRESYSVIVQKEPPAGYDNVPPTVSPKTVQLININTASEEELCLLDGIGPVIAKRIVEYRNERGLFAYSFELMNVNGIGTAVYDKIRNLITIE